MGTCLGVKSLFTTFRGLGTVEGITPSRGMGIVETGTEGWAVASFVPTSEGLT